MNALRETPLSLAASLGDSDGLKLLLEAGADPDIPEPGSPHHPLRSAVRAGSISCFLLLKNPDIPLNITARRENTLLHDAATHSRGAAIPERLIAMGFPLEQPNFKNCTPLSFTPLKDNVEAARYFLRIGANIGNTDMDGDTPLTESIRRNAHKCLELFLSEGANYHTVNRRGRTILHFAGTFAGEKTLRILTSKNLYGLSTEALDRNGKTPRACFQERSFVSPIMAAAFEQLLSSLNLETDF
jgi:ankyrin repeat protein